MPRSKKKRTGSQLDEALDIFVRAKELYPIVLKERDYHAGEVRRLEEALERLRAVAGAPAPKAAGPKPSAAKPSAAKPSAAPKAKAPAARAKPGRPKAGGPTIASLVLDALSGAKKPLSASEVLASVGKQRSVSKANLQNVLKALRDSGAVKATGKAKRFQYTIGNKGAVAPAKPAAAKAAAKPGRKPKGGNKPKGGSNGSPRIRDVVTGVLKGGRSLSRAELIKAALGAGTGAKESSIAVTIDNLRREGIVKVSGEKRAYKYALA